jgi:hypothetical protein
MGAKLAAATAAVRPNSCFMTQKISRIDPADRCALRTNTLFSCVGWKNNGMSCVLRKIAVTTETFR